MNEFKKYHPFVNFIYFVFVIGLSMILMQPACLTVSVLCSIVYLAVLSEGKGIGKSLGYMLPVILLMGMINPIFNHEGVTILGYLPGGNPITAESVIYGFAAAMMLGSVMCWFLCYNSVMTSDKFIYLFGKVIPSLSLVISMTLRFVPLFVSRVKKVSYAQRCIGKGVQGKGIIKKAKSGLEILSGMITWSFENAVDVSDSMKARGYGLGGRTAFSLFVFDKRDLKMLIYIILTGGYVLACKIAGCVDFEFFPCLNGGEITALNISVPIIYFMLCISPVVIEVWEVRKWHILKSKI